MKYDLLQRFIILKFRNSSGILIKPWRFSSLSFCAHYGRGRNFRRQCIFKRLLVSLSFRWFWA